MSEVFASIDNLMTAKSQISNDPNVKAAPNKKLNRKSALKKEVETQKSFERYLTNSGVYDALIHLGTEFALCSQKPTNTAKFLAQEMAVYMDLGPDYIEEVIGSMKEEVHDLNRYVLDLEEKWEELKEIDNRYEIEMKNSQKFSSKGRLTEKSRQRLNSDDDMD